MWLFVMFFIYLIVGMIYTDINGCCDGMKPKDKLKSILTWPRFIF